jgi:isoleucyl-tRNA synthetase
MSKSLGNVIEPMEVIKAHGAEILRLWAASLVFGEDATISPEMLIRLSEAYRKLRNTFRYCLANLYDFDPEKDSVASGQLEEIDTWALARTADVLERVETAYNDYAFHKVYRALYDFATVDLSAFYFDILKDRLYTSPGGSVPRRAAQTALYRIAESLARAVAPLMCFTAEEVWSHLPAPHLREPSVHLTKFPAAKQLRQGVPEEHLRRLKNWPRLIEVRDEVLKALETARQDKAIGSPLEAKVILATAGPLAPILEAYSDMLPTIFIVSRVEFSRDVFAESSETALPGLKVRIEKARGKKCDRCWNYSERVGEDARYPTVCDRCSKALKEIEAASQ